MVTETGAMLTATRNIALTAVVVPTMLNSAASMGNILIIKRYFLAFTNNT